MSRFYGFSITWGKSGVWSPKAQTLYLPQKNLWTLHTNNTFLPTGLLESDLMQSDGSIKMPYSGQYEITMSLFPSEYAYPSGLLAYMNYKAANSASTMKDAKFCNILFPGMCESLGIIDNSRRVQLNKGDLLIPTFKYSDDYDPFSFATPSAYNTITLSFSAHSAPNLTYSIRDNMMITDSSHFDCNFSFTIGANGSATVSLITSDNLPIFKNIIGGVFNYTGPSVANSLQTPFVISYKLSADMKSLLVNAVVNATSGILLGGSVNGLQFAPNGSIFNATVWGSSS